MILKYMSLDLATFHSVMVQVWVGKDFPDMRQNEREIKFIRMGDSYNSGPAQGKTDVEQGSLVHFYTQGKGVG